MSTCHFLILSAAALLLYPQSARAGQQMQGQQMQGQQMQGQQMQGTSAQGTSPGASLTSGGYAVAEVPLNHFYSGWLGDFDQDSPAVIKKGELFLVLANGTTISGKALVGAYVPADRNGNRVWTIINSVSHDPTFPEGGTSLYGIDVINSDGTTSPLCGPDRNGVSAAIPVAALFNTHGDRVESTTQFTFSCTSGVVAKCYRWGYRPWLQGAGSPDEFTNLHWACVRMARADYCGNGQTWTHTGTLINMWDLAPAPGPFQSHGPSDPTFVFEAGWSTRGAVCLSKQRWATLPPDIAANCPDRLVPPGASTSAGTVCNSSAEVPQFDATTELFNESKVNVSP